MYDPPDKLECCLVKANRLQYFIKIITFTGPVTHGMLSFVELRCQRRKYYPWKLLLKNEISTIRWPNDGSTIGDESQTIVLDDQCKEIITMGFCQ